jgi:hypothetical protein
LQVSTLVRDDFDDAAGAPATRKAKKFNMIRHGRSVCGAYL